jgi:hypothetical protein
MRACQKKHQGTQHTKHGIMVRKKMTTAFWIKQRIYSHVDWRAAGARARAVCVH